MAAGRALLLRLPNQRHDRQTTIKETPSWTAAASFAHLPPSAQVQRCSARATARTPRQEAPPRPNDSRSSAGPSIMSFAPTASTGISRAPSISPRRAASKPTPISPRSAPACRKWPISAPPSKARRSGARPRRAPPRRKATPSPRATTGTWPPSTTVPPSGPTTIPGRSMSSCTRRRRSASPAMRGSPITGSRRCRSCSRANRCRAGCICRLPTAAARCRS